MCLDENLHGAGLPFGDKGLGGVGDVVEHWLGEAGEDAEPEDLVHDEVGVLHTTDDPALNALVGRLAEQVAGEH